MKNNISLTFVWVPAGAISIDLWLGVVSISGYLLRVICNG